MRPIGALILAGGASRRLGQPKQLVTFEGEPLVRRVALQAQRVVAGPVVVVTGANGEAVAAALAGADVEVSHCPDWARGPGATLKHGVALLEARVRALLVLLSDQPLIPDASLRALHDHDSALVAADYDGVLGAPAKFGAEWFEALRRLPDEDGAKTLLRDEQMQVARVKIPEAAQDVDVTEDLARLRGR